MKKKIGISAVRNKALIYLRNINCEYFCFLDDDCIFEDNFISNHLKFIKQNNCSIVTGPQIYKSKKTFLKYSKEIFLKGVKFIGPQLTMSFLKRRY